MTEREREVGTVHEWRVEKGFGKARGPSGWIRVHHRDLDLHDRRGRGDLTPGQQISYRVELTPEGRQAREVRLVDDSRDARPLRATLADLPGARARLERMKEPMCATREALVQAGLLKPADENEKQNFVSAKKTA